MKFFKLLLIFSLLSVFSNVCFSGDLHLNYSRNLPNSVAIAWSSGLDICILTGITIIKGKVIDENKKPIQHVNVSIHSKKDSSLIKGVVTQKDGSFEIIGIAAGEYYLNISFIGYTKKVLKNISIGKDQKEIDLGITELEPTAYQMKETQVIGEKPMEEFQHDKKVINVSRSLTSKSGTALEVLQDQPSVRTDADGNISLRGSTNFTVQVNGRPSVLQGSDALRQIPANTIESIELITNPSAKYDAEGSAGIINIILKKTFDDNFNGLMNAGMGSRNKYNGDATFNYRSSNWNYTAGFDYRNYTAYIFNGINRTIDNVTGPIDNISDIDIRAERETFSGRLGVDYNITQNTLIALSGSAGKFNINQSLLTKMNNRIVNTASVYSVNDFYSEYPVDYINGGLYFSHKFAPNVDELIFDATITSISIPFTQHTIESLSDIFYKPSDEQPKKNDIVNTTDQVNSRIKLNYKYTLKAGRIVEIGVQANLFYKDMDYKSTSFNYEINEWLINPFQTYAFNFKNNVYAGFATYSDNLLEWSYQLGLRIEYTDRLLEQKTMGKNFEYGKMHLFPSLSITKKFGLSDQIQFSYSRRINRPQDFFLNPYTTYSDSYTISQGNPELLPELTNSFELNYQKYFSGSSVSIQTYLRDTKDGITRSTEVLGDKLLLSFANLSSSRAIGAEISGGVTLFSWWRIDPAINLFDYRMESTINKIYSEDHTFTWNLRFNSFFTLPSGTRLQFTGYYNAKNIIPQGEMESFFYSVIAIRQEFFNKLLTVNLSAQNLFNSLKFNLKTNSGNLHSIVSVRNESPVYMLTLSYNFNNFKRSQRNQEGVDVNVGNGI